MTEAIRTGRLTPEAERLNLREFCDRLAEATGRSGTRVERGELESGTPRGRTPRREADRQSRWAKPGGPI